MKKVLTIILVPVVLFIAWALLRTPSPEEKERGYAKDGIDRCWEAQGRKSVDPSTARAMAGICEGLEASYTAKWGRKP